MKKISKEDTKSKTNYISAQTKPGDFEHGLFRNLEMFKISRFGFPGSIIYSVKNLRSTDLK